MPTVDEYREKLGRAMAAGDQEAVDYFQRQIAKGEAMPVPSENAAGGRQVPQGGSIMSPIAQGATLGFADEIGGGASGLFNVITGRGSFKEGYEGTRDSLREAASQYAERNPATSFVTELVSGALLPLGAARSVAQGVRLGAAAGAVTGAGKNEDPDKLTQDVLVGGGLGGAAGGIGSALGGLYRTFIPQRSPNARGPNYQADIARLEAEGIPVTPAERLGSRSARKAEKDVAAYFGADDNIAARPNQIRSRIMERGGFMPDDVAAGELSDGAVARAADYFSREYDNILRGTAVDLQDMDPALNAVERRFFGQLMDHEQKAEVRRILNDFRDHIANFQNVGPNNQITTTITGGAYKRLRSNMGKRRAQLAAQEGPNASLAPIYRDIQSALDDAFRASAPPSLVSRLRDVDSQYRHYAFLRDMVQNPNDTNAIANRIINSNADPDLKELVRAYQNVVLRGADGEKMADASGQLMPPLMSVLKAGGARMANAQPQPRFQTPRIPDGVPTGAAGQAAGMFGVAEGETLRDRERKRRRRRRYREAD